mmetsp:Transcript_40704/g.79855  ORF Transcript_40704/g.79855 Transcript_40704/m.79855 type:complete len:119 (-) Transcript_40704:1443-1799(-)
MLQSKFNYNFNVVPSFFVSAANNSFPAVNDSADVSNTTLSQSSDMRSAAFNCGPQLSTGPWLGKKKKKRKREREKKNTGALLDEETGFLQFAGAGTQFSTATPWRNSDWTSPIQSQAG